MMVHLNEDLNSHVGIVSSSVIFHLVDVHKSQLLTEAPLWCERSFSGGSFRMAEGLTYLQESLAFRYLHGFINEGEKRLLRIISFQKQLQFAAHHWTQVNLLSGILNQK